MIPCLKLLNVIPRRSDVKKILKQYSRIVPMRGIAFVLFGTSQKRHVRKIGEKQIVDGFSTLHVIMDLWGLLLTAKANQLAGAA